MGSFQACQSSSLQSRHPPTPGPHASILISAAILFNQPLGVTGPFSCRLTSRSVVLQKGSNDDYILFHVVSERKTWWVCFVVTCDPLLWHERRKTFLFFRICLQPWKCCQLITKSLVIRRSDRLGQQQSMLTLTTAGCMKLKVCLKCECSTLCLEWRILSSVTSGMIIRNEHLGVWSLSRLK